MPRFLDLAACAGWVVDDDREAAMGILARNDQGQQAMTRVTLRPRVRITAREQPTEDELRELHHRAHCACFMASTVRTEVECGPVLATHPRA